MKRLAGWLVLVVLGCGGEERARGPDADAGEAQRGGTAVIGGYVDLRGMNPFNTLPDVNKAIERFALYTPLVLFDSVQVARPWLAERWDTVRVTPDTLALTFTLRTDVKWHDGHAVTSDDVIFTFERAKDPRTAYVDAGAFEPYAPRAERIDARTLRVRFRAHPDFLEPWFLLPPLPRHLLGGVAPERLAQHPFGTSPVGSGPFRFVRRVPGSEWVFEANPDFPEALGGRPYLDRVIYRIIPEQTALVTELLTGRVDLALSVRPPQVPLIAEREELRVLEFPVANWIFLGLNTRLPYFDTRDERRAIASAIDRVEIVNGIMGGRNVPGRGTVTPVHWAFDTTNLALAPRRNATLSKSLLEVAGWSDRDGDGIREDARGRPFRFPLMVWQGSGTYHEMAQVIQAQLREVGVAVDIEVREFNTFLKLIDGTPDQNGNRKRDFGAVIGNLTDNLRKDDSQLFHSRNADGLRFWSGFSSPRTDTLLDSLGVTMDREAALPLWREYQQVIAEEAPVVVLFYAKGINGARRDLHGLVEDWRGPLASLPRWWKTPAAK